ITFDISSNQVGTDLEIDDTDAVVTYTDPSGVPQSVLIPQAYINVSSCNGLLFGYKLLDTDCDGVGDEPIEGWRINLTDSSNPGVVLQTNTTDSDGYFEFITYKWGNYDLTEENRPGYGWVTPSTGTYEEIYVNGNPVGPK